MQLLLSPGHSHPCAVSMYRKSRVVVFHAEAAAVPDVTALSCVTNAPSPCHCIPQQCPCPWQRVGWDFRSLPAQPVLGLCGLSRAQCQARAGWDCSCSGQFPALRSCSLGLTTRAGCTQELLSPLQLIQKP